MGMDLMTELKIKRLQLTILNEIASVVNGSMSTDNKLKIVRATLDRYDTQLNNLQIDEAIKDLAKKDRAIVEAKNNGNRTSEHLV